MPKRNPDAHNPSPSTLSPPQIDGLMWACETPPAAAEWLLPGMIPRDAVTILEGRKAVGKSSVAAAIAASITGGPAIPGWSGPRMGRVVWCASEDNWASMVIPRLIAAGANLHRVARPRDIMPDGKRRRLILPDDIGQLRDDLAAAGAELLVLDPFVSLCSPGLDVRIEQQARLYLEPLVDMAWEIRCSVLMTRHLRKGVGGDAREAGLGNVAIANVARSIIRCDEHPHEQERWIASVVACNHGRPGTSQVYRLLDTANGCPRVDWCGAIDLDAQAIAEGRGTEADRDEWHDADQVLAAVIGDQWVRVGEVQHRAEQAGITPRMLRRAKARLGIPSRQRQVGSDHYWEWGPPARGWPFGTVVASGGERHTRARAPGGSDAPKTPKKPRRKTAGDRRRPRPHTRPPSDPPDTPTEEASNGTSAN